MIFVDSSVWIDYFNGASTPAVEFLNSQATPRNLIVGDLVLMEVLQGFRDQLQCDRAAAVLLRLRCIEVVDRKLALQAADNYRQLRRRGLTVRSTIDALIAARCIQSNFTLLHSDRDFDIFVEHFGLKSALAVSRLN